MKNFLITKNPAYIYIKPDFSSIPLTSAEIGVKLVPIIDVDRPVIKNGWYAVKVGRMIGWINETNID